MVAGDTWIGVDRQGYGFFDLDVSGEGGSKRITTYPVQHILAIPAGHTEIGVDRQGYGFFDLDVSDDSEFFPSFGRS